jgi:hypothetical protein
MIAAVFRTDARSDTGLSAAGEGTVISRPSGSGATETRTAHSGPGWTQPQ